MIQHEMRTTSWQLAATSTLDDDPGADYVSSLHPERAENRVLHQRDEMGDKVNLDCAG